MRAYETVIQAAQLLASSPEAVAVFLEKRAARSKEELQDDPVDVETEVALRNRDDPLINLALARHGRFVAALQPLFKTSESSSPIRLAVLSNTAVGSDSLFSGFPVSLFGGPEQTAAWLAAAPSEEIAALFENPKLDDSFLRDVLEGSKPWDSVSNDQLAAIVARLSRNERMRTPYDDSYMDGYAEYSYGAVFNAAWKLAERVPANERWARVLCWLYDRMETAAFSIDKPLDLAARWRPDPANAKLIEDEVKRVKEGWLSDYQGVRKGLGRLALSKDSKRLPILLASDDPALRSAAYSDGRLTPDELVAGYRKDGPLVFEQAMHNHNIWRTAEGREALKSVAWSVVQNDKHSDLMAANVYNSIERDLAKKHPEWFKGDENFEARISESSEPATKADMAALAERLTRSETEYAGLVDYLKQTLQVLSRRLEWVLWLSVAAVVLAILRRF
jgi:hypothetical protein